MVRSVARLFLFQKGTLVQNNSRRRYVTVTDAAEYLGVHARTIRQMIADGRLTGYRSGQRLIRVDLVQIDAAMKPFGGAA